MLTLTIWLLCGLCVCGILNFIDHLQGAGNDIEKPVYVAMFLLGGVAVIIILGAGLVFLVRDQGEKLLNYLERRIR